MGQALYRKYRSKSLGEIIGQEHVTDTLKNALKQGRISHAYLLTGPRGVGKTSIARILAHEINNLPYDDKTHLDIIEIDAASNRRIDEIRDLRDRVNNAPAAAKYKVYIIDEVHMLTREAFNALLKTLEEPPAHVVFILATTEAHKLPETIVSRTQRYTFRPVAMPQVVAHLKTIAAAEQIAIDDDALELIAEHGEGSFRDSISLLDQASSTSEHIQVKDIERILGRAPSTYIDQIVTAVQQADSAQIVTNLQATFAQGYEPAIVAGQIGATIRTSLLQGSSADPSASLQLLNQLLNIPTARDPKRLLELTLLQSAFTPTGAPGPVVTTPTTPKPSSAVTTPQATEPATISPVKQPSTQPEPVLATSMAGEELPDKEPEQIVTVPEVIEPLVSTEDITELWQQTLNEIKKQYNTLYGIARMATPVLNGSTLTLTLKFAFHQKRLNEVKNRKIFDEILERLSGKPITISCVVAEPAGPTSQPDVSAISNIFGGAELLK